MSESTHIKEYFHDVGVDYSIFPSMDEETEEVAVRWNVECMARAMLLRIDGNFAILVTCLMEKPNFERMKDVLGAQSITAATEEECLELFPNCDSTALPVLGDLYNMRVYCTKKVLTLNTINFNPGTHDEILSITVDDFIKLAKPVYGDFTDYAGDLHEIW